MGFIGGIVNISIGAIMLSSLFIYSVQHANTTGTPIFTATGGSPVCTLGALVNCTVSYPYAWSTAELTLWSVLVIAGIVGLIVGTLNIFGIM